VFTLAEVNDKKWGVQVHIFEDGHVGKGLCFGVALKLGIVIPET
jgi:hypothetical protein